MILFIYRILINFVFIFSPFIILIRVLKKKEDIKRFMLQKFLTQELELQLMIDLKELQNNEIRSKKFRKKV